MILSLFMNKYGYLDRLDVTEVLRFEAYMHEAMTRDYATLLSKIRNDYSLQKALIQDIKNAMEEIYTSYRGIYYGT